ncbi:MAG TPA: HAD family phosphatase, partial [Candidatus Paceibacterota bacterium]|nr:HAD family phosphatase [Candidatus Paceibacterota bacterium]
LPIALEEYMRIIRDAITPIAGTRGVIESLRAQGYKLGLLSDHGREWAAFCEEKFDHHRLYDAVVYSFDVGFCKPDAAMFARALALLNAEPEEALFIDDNPRNVAGAEAFGIRGILFTDAPTLRKDLSSLGIDA